MLLKSSLLSQIPGLVHGMATRTLLGDDGTWPAEYWESRENILASKMAFAELLGVEKKQISTMQQTHSDNIAVIQEPSYPADTDAMITDVPDNFLIVQCADCVPILLAHPNGVVGVIHSGRKGVTKNIVGKAVESIVKEYGLPADEIIAWIGPAICQQHYEVGEDVSQFFAEKYLIPGEKEGKSLLALVPCVADQLKAAGLMDAHIEISTYCTYEESELLYSSRRQGKGFGRNFALMGFK